MKSNLILHCGANAVERGQVREVFTPEPTETWYPISHFDLLEQVEQTLTDSGFRVVSESHGLTREGNRYFGLLQVANGHNNDDFGLVVGVRNSHDKTFPAGLVLGASVFVCDNLSFSGEIRLARKHTRNVWRDMPQITARAVGLLGEQRLLQETRFDTYREAEITDKEAHDLVVRALDYHVCPVTKIPGVLEEWRHPRHPEFEQCGKTGWRLFNAFTETLKGNLNELPRRTQALHGLFDGHFGILDRQRQIAAEIREIQTAQAV